MLTLFDLLHPEFCKLIPVYFQRRFRQGPHQNLKKTMHSLARFILETDHPSGTNLGKER